eukprot:GHVU01185830.1.p1 GENE.GHVU01185830.1~~GHVU01185830.1.p1  ORF type:complete len:221 (+),score=47.38 GHVU01185830.1:74-736(+)
MKKVKHQTGKAAKSSNADLKESESSFLNEFEAAVGRARGRRKDDTARTAKGDSQNASADFKAERRSFLRGAQVICPPKESQARPEREEDAKAAQIEERKSFNQAVREIKKIAFPELDKYQQRRIIEGKRIGIGALSSKKEKMNCKTHRYHLKGEANRVKIREAEKNELGVTKINAKKEIVRKTSSKKAKQDADLRKQASMLLDMGKEIRGVFHKPRTRKK